MKKQDTNETVEVMLVSGRFYLATDNPKYEFYPRRQIPKWLWDWHNEIQPKAIDVQRQIREYFKPTKDVPMYVAKNHVNENEIHKFNDDGSVTINKKNEALSDL